jgi:type I restriction enzyme R subunit
MVEEGDSLRTRLRTPVLDETGLQPAQIKAVNNLEHSFKKNRPKALIYRWPRGRKTF